LASSNSHEQLSAKGNGTSAANTLLNPASARPAALGEAFTAMQDDISAMDYNPASVKSLSSGQASFFYQKGLTDDAHGNFLIGTTT